MSSTSKEKATPLDVIGATGKTIELQSAKITVEMEKVVNAWGRMILVAAAGQMPAAEDRIAAAIAVRAAQAELHTLADMLGATSLLILAAFDQAANEVPN